jgi:hypothetical protein
VFNRINIYMLLFMFLLCINRIFFNQSVHYPIKLF